LDLLIKPFHPIHGQSPFYKGTGIFQKAHSQDWLTAAFFMIKREVFEEVGGFDEDYFMYTEEVDYCWRIKKAGWQVCYQPTLSITHLGGASSTQEFPILSEYKGIKLFYKKHMPGWQYPFLITFLKSGAALRAIIFGILKGRQVAKIYAKAFQTA
jgi:GT2 family glycosyltransferase